MIGTNGERDSEKSVLAARLDDENIFLSNYFYSITIIICLYRVI